MPAGRVFRQVRAQFAQRRNFAISGAVTGTLAKTLANATVASAGTASQFSYSYNWTGTNGSAWTNWTTVSGTVNVQTNQGRELTAATAYAVAAAYYNNPLPQNYDLRVDATVTTATATEYYGAVNVRAGLTTFTDMMQNSSWHLRWVGISGAGWIEAYRIDGAGVPFFLGSGAGVGFNIGSVLHLHVALSGQNLKVRYWKNAETEPSTWAIDVTDASAPTGTGMSLAVRNGNDVAADDWRWDNLSVTSTFVAGSLARTLGNATVAAAGNHASVGGSVNQTLASVITAGPILDENGLQILDENSLPILADGAVGTFFSSVNAGTVDATLGNLTSTSAGVSVTGTVTRTLQNATVAASSSGGVAGSVARTLQPVTISAAGGLGVTGTLAKTLAGATVVAAGAAADIAGTVAVTLDSIEVNSPLTDDTGAVITDDAGNPILVRGAEGQHGLGATVARTLANVTSAASGVTGGGTGTLARTLANTTSTTAGGFGPAGTLAKTLAAVVTTTVGTVGVTGTAAVTLANATSAASGTSTPPLSGVAGSVGLTLANVTLAASGNSVGGVLADTLADTTSAASGTFTLATVTGTANITLANVTSAAVGYPVDEGTLTRTLDDVGAVSVGSSVAGTVNVTLDDITTTTIGSVTITVYALGAPSAVFNGGSPRPVFDMGRIVAVARSSR